MTIWKRNWIPIYRFTIWAVYFIEITSLILLWRLCWRLALCVPLSRLQSHFTMIIVETICFSQFGFWFGGGGGGGEPPKSSKLENVLSKALICTNSVIWLAEPPINLIYYRFIHFGVFCLCIFRWIGAKHIIHICSYSVCWNQNSVFSHLDFGIHFQLNSIRIQNHQFPTDINSDCCCSHVMHSTRLDGIKNS